MILLVGCSSKNNSAKNNGDNHTVSSKSIKTQTTSESSSSVTKESTSVSNFWNDYKSQRLNQFMNTWSKTMGQNYTEYGLDHNLNYFGLEMPEQMDQFKLNINGQLYSAGWSDSGTGNYDYNVVALYSNHDPQSGETFGYMYYFAYRNGNPIVLVTHQTNGDVQADGIFFKETDNSQLRSAFSDIANGENP